MHNEHRKLLLWLDLFGSSQSADPYFTGNIDPRKETDAVTKGGAESGKYNNTINPLQGSSSSSQAADLKDIESALGALAGSSQHTAGNSADKADMLKDQLIDTVQGIAGITLALQSILGNRGRTSPQDTTKQIENNTESVSRVNTQPQDHEFAVPAEMSQSRSWNWTNLPDSTLYSSSTTNVISAEDLTMGRTPQSAAETLQAAKEQLMARLQESSQLPAEGEEEGQQYAVLENDEERAEGDEGDIRGSDVAADGSVEEEDEEDEEYHGPGDQERGLLTDIPLVLGPTEIEALPMIIQAGIVDGFGPKTSGNNNKMQKMQAVRCNILLAQEPGRNLLRELLIFIAAWDLTDDEFYFKMMQQIMEAILQNGLMPFAYQTFGE